jgi:hypothetical protein
MERRDVSRLASNLYSIHGLSPVRHVVESALSPSAARQVNQVTCSARLPSMHGCFVGRGAVSRIRCALTNPTAPPGGSSDFKLLLKEDNTRKRVRLHAICNVRHSYSSQLVSLDNEKESILLDTELII